MIVVGRVGSYPTTEFNTVGKYAFELSKHNSLKTFVFTPKYPGKPLENSNVREVRSYKVWARRSFPQYPILKQIAGFCWVIYMMLVQTKAIFYFAKKSTQVIHLHSQMYTLVAIWGRIMKKKVFLTFHGEDYNNLIKSKLLQSLLFPYDSIFVISPIMKSGVEQWFKKDVIYTPNGVNRSIYRNLNQKRNKDILCVGSFKKVKRHSILMNGFANLIKANYFDKSRLILAGSGPLEKKLREQATELGISDKVIFTGNLSSSELVQEYNKAMLLVLISEREGFPKVILEGLSCGIKIASTKVGAVPEVLGERYPYYIEDLSPKGVGDLLFMALNDQNDVYLEIEKYSWNALREKIVKYYV
jgi:glycosyltransferase involved in cell wall biosynthesis